jgi:hypothetical protein
MRWAAAMIAAGLAVSAGIALADEGEEDEGEEDEGDGGGGGGDAAGGDGVAEMYGDDDLLEEKLEIERYLGLFLVKPPRRHSSEMVDLYRQRATVRYWYSLGPDVEQVACDGLRWMLFGRHQWAGGVHRIFEETEVKEVNLHFIHVPKSVGGKTPGKKDFRRFVEMRLTRRKVEKLEVSDARHAIESGEGCAKYMKKHFDRFRFDSRFYKRELKRHSRK